MREEKKVSESASVMTVMVMPNDTNPLDNLMGGNLMRWMDVIGGICAGKHTEAYVVTACVDHVSFDKPINNGDVVTLEAYVTRAFTTSVEIFVEVFAADIKGNNTRKCNHAYFTFVAIDDITKKPKKIPAVLPLTNEQQERYEAANRRRELRLLIAGRMKVNDAKDIKEYFNAFN